MKRIMLLLLAGCLLFGEAVDSAAMEFQGKGEWLFGFGALNSALAVKENGRRTARAADDRFGAVQRLNLQMDAVASEALSGTVMFEIGDTVWGQNKTGGALGADGKIVELKWAYITWTAPGTALNVRMGLQGLALPNTAGGSAVFDDDVAAVAATYRFNDAVSLAMLWARPYNDNWYGEGNRIPAGYLDNVDVFALSLPITGDGWRVNPWVVYGIAGVNNFPLGETATVVTNGLHDMNSGYLKTAGGWGNQRFRRNSDAYSNLYWFGLPMAFTRLDPWNFELDLNYGYAGSIGRYDITDLRNGEPRRGMIQRQGWLAKALVEYNMDWGTPGVFGWYGSGDDGNVKNGSERMPTVSPCGNFTSFMGHGERGWSVSDGVGTGYDLMLSYSGTWGVGARLKDMTFVEDLRHTLRVAYWGGTNSPAMSKYLSPASFSAGEGVYLTTRDGLVEINLDSSYNIYENLEAVLELGYVVNAVDKGTWNRSFKNGSYEKSDAYKAALIFNYSF